MNKFIVFSIILFNFFNGFAHGADISTFVLKEQNDHTWTLQIRSSLEAFRKEVKTHFVDCPYSTTEEFNTQVLEHFGNTLKITIDGKKDIALVNGKVRLGHESVVFYKDIILPEHFTSIQIAGSMFKEIYRSRVKVLIIKKEFEKNTFFLNKKNNFTLDLFMKEKQFKLWSREEES